MSLIVNRTSREYGASNVSVHLNYVASLVPRPSITANVVEGLVKLLCRMTSGRHLEAWHFRWTAVLVHAHIMISHASRGSPDIILHRSFTRSSTAFAVIEGLGMRLLCNWIVHKLSHVCISSHSVFSHVAKSCFLCCVCIFWTVSLHECKLRMFVCMILLWNSLLRQQFKHWVHVVYTVAAVLGRNQCGVPCRNWTLFRYVFRPHYCIVAQDFC